MGIVCHRLLGWDVVVALQVATLKVLASYPDGSATVNVMIAICLFLPAPALDEYIEALGSDSTRL